MTLVIRSELAVTRKTKDTRLGASGGTGCVAFQSDKRETARIIYKKKFLYGQRIDILQSLFSFNIVFL